MLVLSRRNGESIDIGKEISVTVVKIHGKRVTLGIVAPDGTSITRREITEAMAAGKIEWRELTESTNGHDARRNGLTAGKPATDSAD